MLSLLSHKKKESFKLCNPPNGMCHFVDDLCEHYVCDGKSAEENEKVRQKYPNPSEMTLHSPPELDNTPIDN